MEVFDRVKLISDNKRFVDVGLEVGHEGIVLGSERNGYYLVSFDGEIVKQNGVYKTSEIDIAVRNEEVKVLNNI